MSEPFLPHTLCLSAFCKTSSTRYATSYKPLTYSHHSSRDHSDDDSHDHIGSISATPSGVATPHPDPSDKRLPGILQSCFGQVGERLSISPSTHQSPVFLHFVPDMGESSLKLDPSLRIACALPTTPTSSTETSTMADQQPLPCVSYLQKSRVAQRARPDSFGLPPYPTPPTSSSSSSSSSSSTPRTSEAGSEESSNLRASDSPDACRRCVIRQQSGHRVVPLQAHRQTGGLNPLCNITTNSSVHAAYLSNPTASRPSTRPSTPTPGPLARNALSSLTSHLELVKLTDDVASPRNKNTPPLTPRALSTDGSESTKHSQRTTDVQNGKITHTGQSQPTPHSSPSVGPPKGKLSVTVSQARGLRPSYNPYAVTVFEWIESVARPSKTGTAEMKYETKCGEQNGGGVPIRKSGSDMGRSMAIPMKSRQSSTTSLSDQKDFKNGRHITDPRWDQVAIL